MIFIAIGIIIALYGFYNFQKGFILYLAYKLVLVTNITLVSIPGIPLLTLEMFLTMWYVILFFLNKKKYQFAHEPFPLLGVFASLTMCWLISSIFAIAGFGAELSNLIKNILEEILLVWMIWEVLEEIKDFRKLYNYITIIIFISCIYAFIEYIIQQNPIALYEATLNNDSTKVYLGLYNITERGYRVQSFFEHAIGAGVIWGLYSAVTFRNWVTDNKSVSRLAFITAFLCIICVILTKMRSAILFTAIAYLSLISFRKKRFYVFVVLGIIGLFLIYPIISDNILIFKSFINSSAQESVGGSSIAVRLVQFNTAFDVVKASPVVGLGNKFGSALPESATYWLYGMESIWLWTIVQYGLLGTATYIMYMFYTLLVLPKRYKSKDILFVFLAYWVTFTFSSLPGMKTYLIYLVIIYYIKCSNRYKSNVLKGNIYGLYFESGKIKYNIIKRKI